MEVIAFDVEHFHLGVADFDALFVGARIEQTTSTFNPVLVVVAPISSTMARRSVSGRPRQFCVMWQNMRCSILFHLDVPGGSVVNMEHKPCLVSELLQLATFQSRTRAPFEPPQSAVIVSSCAFG